jgi:hypothetical protein
MEDRLTPELYLETTDLPIERYAAERVPAVLALPAVERATWWRNLRRDRRDLPRSSLPDFDHLGVFELREGFRAPATPPGVTGYHFRRYPRPAQGILTGRPTIGLLLVLVSPDDPARAQALRDWADFVHIRRIAEASVPGYGMITPYENVTGGNPRFLHLYEMDSDDPEGAFRSMTPLVMRRIGDRDSEGFNGWASGPGLKIEYVNTFRRIGVTASASAHGQ